MYKRNITRNIGRYYAAYLLSRAGYEIQGDVGYGEVVQIDGERYLFSSSEKDGNFKPGTSRLYDFQVYVAHCDTEPEVYVLTLDQVDSVTKVVDGQRWAEGREIVRRFEPSMLNTLSHLAYVD